MRRQRSSLQVLFVLCIICLTAGGCDKLLPTDDDDPPEMPMINRSDDEEETVATVPKQPAPEPMPVQEPEPTIELPPITLPPALAGTSAECTLNGVVFRATECYRTARGFRLTIYCASGERDATVMIRSDICTVSGVPSGERTTLTALGGPYAVRSFELPRGQVAWFQMDGPGLPREDTGLSNVAIFTYSESNLGGNIEFAGIPISDLAPEVPAEELALIPERFERLITSGLTCNTYWRLDPFLGETQLHFESFDPVTRAVTGHFRDRTKVEWVKSFEGSLSSDGTTLEFTTVRASGWGGRGTTEISNENLYLVGQQTMLTLSMYRSDLLGLTPEGIAFCVELPSQLFWPEAE